MCEKITTTPEIVALQEQFLAAKDAKDQWAAHQLALEEKILFEMAEQKVTEFPVTGSLELEHVVLTFGVTRKWNDFQLNELAAANPHTIGSTLKCTYSLAITKPKVDALIAGGSEFAQQLAWCFDDKPKKVGFAAKK